MKGALFAALAVTLLVAMSGTASAYSYSLLVQTGASSYAGNSTISITGQVYPAPGPNSSVFLRVFNPNMVLSTESVAPVNGTTGLFSSSFVAGGSSPWIDGTYTINASWGAYGPVIFKTTTFSWVSSATSTSTTSSTSTGTASTSSTASSTSSIATSTTSTTTTSTATISSLTSSSTTSSTSASTTSTGGVPEFPFQIVAVVLFSGLIAGSFLIMRSRKGRASNGITH